MLYVFAEDHRVVVSSVQPNNDNYDEVEKNSFYVLVPQAKSVEGVINTVANVLRNGNTLLVVSHR